MNSGERDDLKLLVGLCEVIFPAYCRYWAKDDSQIDWVGCEAKFKVEYDLAMDPGRQPDPISGNAFNVRKIILNGMRDRLFRMLHPTTKKPILGVFETKTKSRISEKEINTGLRADLQTLMYLFVTWLEMGEIPQYVKYNIVRRPDGHVPYRPKHSSVVDYLKLVKDDVAKRPDFYFSRWGVDVTKAELVSFKTKTFDPLLRRFIAWWDGVKKNPLGKGRFEYPHHSLNLNALTTKYGIADVWELIVNQNYRPYRIRSEAFPELADSFLVIPCFHGVN